MCKAKTVGVIAASTPAVVMSPAAAAAAAAAPMPASVAPPSLSSSSAASSSAAAAAAPAPAPQPAVVRTAPVRGMHLKQKGHDTCGIAACTMIGQSLGCTLPPGDVLAFAEKKGIYASGQKSFFHALDQIFTMMGLSSNLVNGKSDAALTALVQQVGVVLVETGSHVIVVDGARQTVNGYSYDVRDPAFTKSETNVSHNDPRLKDRTGRVWAVWR